MYSFGRIEVQDDRDTLFGIAPMLMAVPRISEKFWWDEGWWGDQGNTNECVAYSWSHWIEDGPVIQDLVEGRVKPLFNTTQLYETCQKIDRFPGENYSGTTVRAGAKALQKLGIVTEYRWAFNVDEIVNTLLTLGPMVVGTKWFNKMQFPDKNGLIRAEGRSMGGHAYLLNGVNTEKGYLRIKNSWGRKWGDHGHAYIGIDDFEKLFRDGGEACIARETKITNVPSLGLIIPS